MGERMNLVIKKYYSGYCTYEVEAESKEKAYEMVQQMPTNYDEILQTLEEWEECNEIESADDT
jgi:hypothetical protein